MSHALPTAASRAAATCIPSTAPVSPVSSLRRPLADHRKLYETLLQPSPSADARKRAAQFVERLLVMTRDQASALPENSQDLHKWMAGSASRVTDDYARYLSHRKAGAPRSYFPARSHALHFLKAAAPTKLVDGSWLYGVLQFAGNPRMGPLLRTYIEELGAGDPKQNHVALYQQLLAQQGLQMEATHDDDALYIQGLTQLALGWNADTFLPEIIGFNLGYEQLPLHLLITAYELNELGIDPYYFTLHITVDNHGTGHARAACDAVQALMPRHGDAKSFWNRVRAGFLLGDAGVSTTDMIGRFDPAEEVLRIFQSKCAAGLGMHSDYCRIGGRTVNQWLSQPADMPHFLEAMISAGWIRHGEAHDVSRFWRLLQGDHAEMSGVFSSYELQVIHDWIRGDGLADGAPWFHDTSPMGPTRRPSFRALQRARQRAAESSSAETNAAHKHHAAGDPDLPAFVEQLAALQGTARRDALVAAMSPAEHWTPVGLHATRLFLREAFAA